MKNDISLIDDSGKFLIKRVIYTEAAYTSYKDYYLKYRGNKSKLHLPESYFDDQTRTVLTEFVAEPKLINLFYNCHYGYRGVVKIFKEICPQIDLMHERDEEGLVHGDFSVANVLVDKDNNCYWIIDYFDSFSYEKEYDKYLLIRSILKFFGINVDLHNIQKYLPLNKQKIDEYERIYWLKRAIKRS